MSGTCRSGRGRRSPSRTGDRRSRDGGLTAAGTRACDRRSGSPSSGRRCARSGRAPARRRRPRHPHVRSCLRPLRSRPPPESTSIRFDDRARAYQPAARRLYKSSVAGLELETLPCPDCGAVLPVEKGYVTWCDSCGWNLVAPAAVPPGSRLRRMYASAGRKLGERMVDDLGEVETLERRLTWSLVAAYGIAAAVHALTLALVAGGAFLVWTTFPDLLLMACGALMTTAGILMRPRIQGPPSVDTLTRTDAPDLYRLLDR